MCYFMIKWCDHISDIILNEDNIITGIDNVLLLVPHAFIFDKTLLYEFVYIKMSLNCVIVVSYFLLNSSVNCL